MYLHQVRGFVNIKIINRKCHKIYYNERLTDFPEKYNLNDVRKGWYELWENNKYFQPEDNDKPVYKMILPPPNVTGTLHLGHALTTTLQDVLARWHKMRGYSVIWVPGFDHAGIATQAIVEKYLQKTKNLKRIEMTRDDFSSFVSEWADEKRSIISNQLKTLGASLDWSREYFTISEHHNKAVTYAFLELHQRQLLYRNEKLINWSTALGSTISDIEVELESLSGKTNLEVPGYNKKVTFGQIFEISYNVINSDEKLNVATTRPETLFGDVALAVHPDDPRYSQYIGQNVKHPLTQAHIPIISDPNVKMDFGTGVVKITPAHNHFDYAVANKHDLELITAIDENGKLTTRAGQYAGLPRFQARQKILDDLANMGSLISTKDHAMEIPRCSRTGDIIELLLQEQWFIKCEEMSLKALNAIENGSLKLDPSFHNKTWMDWLSNNKDWCVSRQLWWGHRIPAYHFKVDNVTKWIVAASQKEAQSQVREQYGDGIVIHQDNDVLDTWFSSSLLPFSAMGWQTSGRDLKNFYPLSLMETGHDIIFFWVARMVMLGLELTNRLPFNEVLLHGVLCDAQGKKMSKSRGNVIYPENVLDGISLEKLNDQATKSFEAGILSQSEYKRTVQMNTKMFPNGIPECGVDALRFTLCSRNIKERTVSFNIIECEQNKFFCNKIWQASRYVVLMTSDGLIETPKTFTMLDQWILSRLTWMVDTVNKALEQKNFYKAVMTIKEFVYYEFCDYYIEGTKSGFLSQQLDVINSQRYTLAKCLEVSLRILAPFTPYLSDDLYSRLSEKLSVFDCCDSLLESSYPSVEELANVRNLDLENQMNKILKTIYSIKCLMGILTGMKNTRELVEIHIAVNTSEEKELYEHNLNILSAMSKVNNVKIFTTEQYVKNSNVLCETAEQNCTVYAVINDDDFLQKARKKLEDKKITAQKKLNSLMKLKSRSKYESTTPEENKVQHQKQISILQGELKRLSSSS